MARSSVVVVNVLVKNRTTTAETPNTAKMNGVQGPSEDEKDSGKAFLLCGDRRGFAMICMVTSHHRLQYALL